ncbi:MAG: mannosyltransferase [Peltula sp. TS41687]|nr:MAG: mannosyltransferase [Peltula sp. TS41687]
MLGMAAFMDWRGGLKTAQGIMWFGIGGILGWPFASALAIPFLLEETALALIDKIAFEQFIWRVLNGVTRCLIVLALGVGVDLFFYHSLVVVPFNIVKYNIFSGSSKGPNIFGTEPWHFYFRNLLLNFNIWFILALLALPITLLRFGFSQQVISTQTRLRSLVFLSPFYLWLLIFTLQAHKEERFIYPAYPALGLNAAISLHFLLSSFGSTDPRRFVGHIPPNLKLVVVGCFMTVTITTGLLRTLGIMTAYSAPFEVHKALVDTDTDLMVGNICYGKEWYRYPSSYFLRGDQRAKFIKSTFDGLLPGEFSEAKTGFGFWPTWLIPSGMNDENQEDVGKYIDISHCSFLVDSYFPDSNTSKDEPHHILNTDVWEKVSCTRFLDTARTGLIGRTLWVPDWELVPDSYRRKWGEYCLLRRRIGK